MGSGTFRLKGSSLLSKAKEKKGIENAHQLSMEAKITYQTVYKYFDSEGMKALDLRVLAQLLLSGVGYTQEELMDVKFGDIFEYINNFDNGAAG